MTYLHETSLMSPSYLTNLAELCKKTTILKESCAEKCFLMKTMHGTFFTFLDKMQFSAILCLETMTGFVQIDQQMDYLLQIHPSSQTLVFMSSPIFSYLCISLLKFRVEPMCNYEL